MSKGLPIDGLAQTTRGNKKARSTFSYSLQIESSALLWLGIRGHGFGWCLWLFLTRSSLSFSNIFHRRSCLGDEFITTITHAFEKGVITLFPSKVGQLLRVILKIEEKFIGGLFRPINEVAGIGHALAAHSGLRRGGGGAHYSRRHRVQKCRLWQINTCRATA